MGIQNRSQMTSHCNGNHLKTSVSVCLRQRPRTGALKLYFTSLGSIKNPSNTHTQKIAGGGGGGGGRGNNAVKMPFMMIVHQPGGQSIKLMAKYPFSPCDMESLMSVG